VVIGLSLSTLELERLRGTTVACATAALVASAAVFFVPELASLRVEWPGVDHALLGPSALRVTELSSPLVVLPSGLWLLTVAVTPRSRLDRAGLRRTAAGSVTMTLAFVTESPVLLLSVWVLSTALFLAALPSTEHR